MKTRSPQRPPRWPYRLNREHPLGNGLIAAFVAKPGGLGFVELVRNYSSTVDNSSSGLSSAYIPDLQVPSTQYAGAATNDRVDLGSISSTHPLSLFGRTQISIVAWVKMGTGAKFSRLIDKSSGGLAANGWALYDGADTSTDRRFIFQTAGSTPWYNSLCSNAAYFVDGETICVGMSLPSLSTGKIFKNGREVAKDGRDSLTAFSSTTTNAAIGNWNHSTDRQWRGDIFNIFIYGRPLTDEEQLMAFRPDTRWGWAEPWGFREYFIPPAAGGTTYDKTASDTLNLSDTASETATFSVSTAETLNLADVGSELADFVESLAETLNLLDTASGTTAKVGSVAEALGFADTASETAAFAESIAESLSLLDTATRTAIINRSLAETLNLSDTATGTTGIAVSADETLNLADTTSEIASFLRSVSENLSLTDTAAKTWTGTRTAAGVISFADAATGVGGEAVPSTKGGLSLSEKRMRELERLQMLQRDDDEVIALIARLFR